MRLFPIAPLDQPLNFGHLGLSGQRDVIVADGPRLTEQRGAQSVEGIIRPRTSDHGTESTDRQHSGGERRNQCQAATRTAFLLRRRGESVTQRVGGLLLSDQSSRRGCADLIAPVFEQREQVGFAAVGRAQPTLIGQCVE